MSGRPLCISIHALGGQGGGVLADWIVDLAEVSGWAPQATSVPGVAQRTGSTVYYLELAPPGPEPIMALMPTPGDVDVVLAAELIEAGRAIARGLVTPERTTLIASSHRVFSIAEKSAMGGSGASPAAVLEAAQRASKRLILLDLAALAEAHRSVISATLFGALAGSGELPFPRAAFENVIRRSGKGGEGSLRAFSAAFDAVFAPSSPHLALEKTRDSSAPHSPNPGGSGAPAIAVTGGSNPALSRDWHSVRIAALPAAAQPIATMGVERLLDYQDAGYVALYLDRISAVADADRELGGELHEYRLTTAAARHVTLWMAFEDVIRVADLKTRGSRFQRIEAESRLKPDLIAHTTEFLHPRYEELCDAAPVWLGEWLLGSMRARRLLEPLVSKGRFIVTSRLPGFLLLWTIARLRSYRRRTLRYRNEQQRIEDWLHSAVNVARTDYFLGLEVIRLQRLVKGYGDTHARGLRNFRSILAMVPRLAETSDAQRLLAELHDAALKDDEGIALSRAIRIQEQHTGLPIGAPVIVHIKE